MSDSQKPKSSRKPRSSSGKKRAEKESSILAKFKIFYKECQSIHNSEVKENKEMYELIKELLEKCPPTDKARRDTLNEFITHNNMKLKYVKDLPPIDYLDQYELPTPMEEAPGTPTLDPRPSSSDMSQNNNKKSKLLPELSADAQRYFQPDLHSEDDETAIEFVK